MIGLFEGIEIGTWYRAGAETMFEVVALDLQSETIEIQYYDGAIEELDFDTWLELGAQPCAAPGDAAGALDLNRADYEEMAMDFDSSVQPVDKINPIDRLDWH